MTTENFKNPFVGSSIVFTETKPENVRWDQFINFQKGDIGKSVEESWVKTVINLLVIVLMS